MNWNIFFLHLNLSPLSLLLMGREMVKSNFDSDFRELFDIIFVPRIVSRRITFKGKGHQTTCHNFVDETCHFYKETHMLPPYRLVSLPKRIASIHIRKSFPRFEPANATNRYSILLFYAREFHFVSAKRCYNEILNIQSLPTVIPFLFSLPCAFRSL